MNFEEILNKRRSYRAYLDKEINEEDLSKIIEAGMKAPIAMGRYDNLLIKIFYKEELKKLQDDLVKYAEREITYGAKAFIAIYHKGEKDDLAFLDTGAVIENMLLKATELGVQSVFIYSLVPISKLNKELNKYYKIDDYVLRSCVSLGYAVNINDVKNIEHKIKVIK